MNESNDSMGLALGLAIIFIYIVLASQPRPRHRARARAREPPLQAILEAGPERLRPILMTSAAMILGMLPTALSRGEGSEFRAPMAVAVIGGVISSTLLSLVVMPAFYLAIQNAKAWLGRRRSGRAPAPLATQPRE